MSKNLLIDNQSEPHSASQLDAKRHWTFLCCMVLDDEMWLCCNWPAPIKQSTGLTITDNWCIVLRKAQRSSPISEANQVFLSSAFTKQRLANRKGNNQHVSSSWPCVWMSAWAWITMMAQSLFLFYPRGSRRVCYFSTWIHWVNNY